MPCGISAHRISLLHQASRSGMWRLLIGLLCGIGLAPVFAGEIYRWVDDQGRVHFGDTPPDNAERVEMTPAPAGDPQLREHRERGDRLLDIMEEDRRRRDEEQHARQQADADRRSRCETARRRNAQAADANYIYQATGDPDNPRLLNEAERAEFEQQLQADIRHYCGAGEAPR